MSATTATPPTPLPATAAPVIPKHTPPVEGAEALVFGVEPVLAPSEGQVVALAVMCNIIVSTDGREIVTARPLYEYPLLKRMYQGRGGDAKIEPAWLNNPRTGNNALARTVPLTRHSLRLEMARCQSTFRLPRANGEPRKIFDEVYGIGATNRFVEVVKAQAKAYKALAGKYQERNAKRSPSTAPYLPTADEWLTIATIAEPLSNAVDAMEALEVLESINDPQVEGFDPVDDAHDPSTDLMIFLTGAGLAPEVATAVASLHADNRVGVDALRGHPALNGKHAAIREALSLYQKWLDKVATS